MDQVGRAMFVCAVLLAVAGGCHNERGAYHEMRARSETETTGLKSAIASSGPSTGGTAVPNGRAYDATFFKSYGTNPFVDTDDDRKSTFAVDVDTASYTVARSYLKDGHLPPPESVRAEEFVNYFPYGYEPPRDRTFAVHVEGAPSHFGKNRSLVRIGLKAREVRESARKDAVLTFVIDVSGSMDKENRLGLVKKSLHILVDHLREGDEVGIVTFGSTAEVALTHRDAEDRKKILRAIDRLTPTGSTNTEDGLREGYKLASKAYRPGAINRVILCSDGVANVGRTGPDEMLKEIRRYVQNGITLSSLGFGMENFNDVLLEQLGDKGNGHYAYIDTVEEAERIFGRDLTSTLQLVARDVKVQVDFDRDAVRSYRLIGYENRDVADDKFRDNRTDGGEVGAGHSVTALYEVKSWDGEDGHDTRSARIGTVTVRWRDPEGNRTEEMTEEIGMEDLKRDFDRTSPAFQLAVAAAEFAEILRGSPWTKGRGLDWVQEIARGVGGRLGDRQEVDEFVDLIRRAKKLRGNQDEAIGRGD